MGAATHTALEKLCGAQKKKQLSFNQLLSCTTGQLPACPKSPVFPFTLTALPALSYIYYTLTIDVASSAQKFSITLSKP